MFEVTYVELGNKKENNDFIQFIKKATTENLKYEGDLVSYVSYMERHNFLNTNKEYQNRLLIVINGSIVTSATKDIELSENAIMFGVDSGLKRILPVKSEYNGTLITTPENIVIAEYFSDYNFLNILFDLEWDWGVNDQITKNKKYIFVKILEELNKLLIEKESENSWFFTNNKEKLKKTVKETIKEFNLKEKENIVSKIEEIKFAIHRGKRKLNKDCQELIYQMRILESTEEFGESKLNKYINELDLISKLNKVKDLYVKDGKIIVHTKELYIHDTDSGDRFYGGEYQIILEPERTDVKFEGGTKRKSYWGESCPHPHVDEKGMPCLGNMQSTVAELCSQYELYALVSMCIDFLESVNRDDPAGKNIYFWDMVDSNGEIIKIGRNDDDYVTCRVNGDLIHYDDASVCPCCEEYAHVDAFARVYNLDKDEFEEMCESCINDDASWNPDTERYEI